MSDDKQKYPDSVTFTPVGPAGCSAARSTIQLFCGSCDGKPPFPRKYRWIDPCPKGIVLEERLKNLAKRGR